MNRSSLTISSGWRAASDGMVTGESPLSYNTAVGRWTTRGWRGSGGGKDWRCPV